MLSYQHSYHAGNHADVLKHIILGDLIAAMQHKESPMFMLDAFAGRGIYDLSDHEAQKNREFDTGIGALWPISELSTPEGIQRWKHLIEHENSDGGFTRLPGSTAMLASMLRPQDRLASCDLHPQEFDALRQGFHNRKNFAFHKRDAYEAMRALLPPKEKRGLVFLDPSFEDKSEYKRIADAVIQVYPHFRAGVYVIWYPLLPAKQEHELFHTLKDSSIRKVLRIEMQGNFPHMQMQGSGMLIVNPPWNAEATMKASLAWIHQHLLKESGSSSYRWLITE